MAARAAAWSPSASCVSAPTLRASSMWPETASTESSTSRIRRSRASSAFCDASWKLSRAARRRPQLVRRPPSDPRSFLGRGECALEPPFLESLAGLDEQLLDPGEIEGRIPTEEGGQMVRRRCRLDLDQDLGRVRRAGEGLHQVSLVLQAEQADLMPFPDPAELAGSQTA